ncbi:hypothetical protein [Agarivorans sp. 1_MG-2023]|uniref:hypothetical protein n=1 Tax=Agarivorans sp. 1_MG-2023 TaxID=3062634 RepID=UPI0026E199DE|nr:hypothetical protein [Agarivorans sp. 1_MG-2023]MDO6765338.1 hypothetical protein [Agarivorans sp. 1_MG-2023]
MKTYLAILAALIGFTANADTLNNAIQWQVGDNNNAMIVSKDLGYVAEFSFYDGGITFSSTLRGKCAGTQQSHQVQGKTVEFTLKQNNEHCSLIPTNNKDKAVVNGSFNRLSTVSFNNATFTTKGFHDALVRAEKIRFTRTNS